MNPRPAEEPIAPAGKVVEDDSPAEVLLAGPGDEPEPYTGHLAEIAEIDRRRQERERTINEALDRAVREVEAAHLALPTPRPRLSLASFRELADDVAAPRRGAETAVELIEAWRTRALAALTVHGTAPDDDGEDAA